MRIRVTADIVTAFYICGNTVLLNCKPVSGPGESAASRLREVSGAAHGGHVRSVYALIMVF